MLRKLSATYLDAPGTACLIVDQRLKNTGIANYTGLDLAQYVRGINSKLPIFVLTNFAQERDEFLLGEWSVEQVIGKDELQDDVQAHTVASRIRRHLETYNDLLCGRAERFRYLLSKSLAEELDEAEQEELQSLQLERTAATLAEELPRLAALEEVVRKHKALLDQFRQSTHGEEADAE